MYIKSITSDTNKEIKTVVRLSTKKGRSTENAFIAEGIRTCATLIENGMKLSKLYVTDAHLTFASTITSPSNVTHVSESIMNKISNATTASGILGVFALPTPPAASELKSGIVLTSIHNPGNLGTLIRTAAAMNCRSVVIIGGVDPWSPKVVQATAGTIAHVNIFRWSWDMLSKNNTLHRLYALVPKGGDPLHAIDKKTDPLLVIGNETDGIPELWVQECKKKISISMPGDAESLNAAIAGSIALYHTFAS